MKKNMIYIGLGMILVAIITYLFRLINTKFFQENLSLTIFLGVLSLVILVIGMILRFNKLLLFTAVGSFIVVLLNMGIRALGLQNSTTLVVLDMALGVVILGYGVIKGK